MEESVQESDDAEFDVVVAGGSAKLVELWVLDYGL